MAEGLEHRKTCVLEGSRMAVGGGRAGPCGHLVKQRFGIETLGFTWVLGTFQKGWWVQAHKELTLSVLEDVSRVLSTRVPTRRLEVLKAPRRICRLPPLPPISSALDASMERC